NPGSGAGGLITSVGRATDGAGNFAEDTIRVFLVNVDALRVDLVQPAAGAVASQGKYIPVSVAAHQKSGVKRIGWLVGGVAGQTAKTADSLVQGSPPFPDTLNFVDSVLVTGSTGFFTIAGFAVDSGNRVGQTSPITVTILSVANDNTPPQIEQFLTLRSEANDTITVPSGGRIVDAIYSANQRELYLTNPSLSRVEIFQAANSTFVTAGIPTAGPQPWGIALWPRDTLGAYGDSIVVANSGGTQLS